MPLDHCVAPGQHDGIEVAHGRPTEDHVFHVQQVVWSDPGVAGYNELGDMTHVTDIAIPSIHLVRDLAITAAEMDPSDAASRFAIVAPEDLGFGLARMF